MHFFCWVSKKRQKSGFSRKKIQLYKNIFVSFAWNSQRIFYIPSRNAPSGIMGKYRKVLVYWHDKSGISDVSYLKWYESYHIWAKNEIQVLIEVGALDQHIFNRSCEFQTKSIIISWYIIFVVCKTFNNSQKSIKLIKLIKKQK